MKNMIKKSVMLMTGSMILAGSLFAKPEVTLTFHYVINAKAKTAIELLEPWAKKIEKDSNGRIEIITFPSMTMGGKPNELYQQAKDGVADITWTLTGYTPGIFKRTEVFELPTVHQGDAVATNIAIYDNMDLIIDDFKGVTPLLVHASAGNGIHTIDKNINSVADLKGLKLRTPSRTGGWMIKELGAEPVGIPLPSLPQALSKKAIDGALLPFQIFPPYKMQQLVKYSYEGPNNGKFGTSIFAIMMNTDRLKSMPKDLQKIIMDNSGIELYKKAGRVLMNSESVGRAVQVKTKGNSLTNFTEKQLVEFNEASKRVVNHWIEDVTKKGIDGKKIVERARESIKKHSK